MEERYPGEKQLRDIPMQENCCSTGPSDEYIIKELFTYHPPSPYQLPRYEAIRTAARYFAEVLLQNVPRGADRSAAIRKLREAVMTANAGIALDGLSL